MVRARADPARRASTPDYRFSLANERTFLAWLRTALALIGGGFAVDQFLPDLRWGWRVGLALALLAAGVLCSLRAVNHWVRCERAMRRGEDLPVSRFPALLSLAGRGGGGGDGRRRARRVGGVSEDGRAGARIPGCSRSGPGWPGGVRRCRAPSPPCSP